MNHEKLIAVLEKEITEIILSMGMPANVKGYYYVRSAIICCITEPKNLTKITSALYPRIAEEYETIPSCVERGIRHAIDITWERGDMSYIKRYFRYSVAGIPHKPTNSEFIAVISDYIRINNNLFPPNEEE